MINISEFILYNGEYLSSTQPVVDVRNRAFQFGDGLFETIRAVNGKVVFFDGHYQRLTEGMKALKMAIPAFFSASSLEDECNCLLRKNNVQEGARIRLSVFRNSGGFYLPSDNSVSYVITVQPIENNLFRLNEMGLAIDVFSDLRKPLNKLSPFKTLNSQLYIMASLFAREKSLNDVLVLNEKGNVIETATSNLFIVSNGVLYTPSLDEGCIGGIMRMQIINIALQQGFKVYECGLNPQRLLSADEIFITNSVKGIQWINRYRAKRFYHKVSDKLLAGLNELILSSVMDPQENLQ